MSHCLCPSAPKRAKQDVGIPAAGSQGLNSPQSHNISVCGCQGGRGLLLRCGTNEAQRLNMQVWPCSTPYGTWGGLPCLWQVTDGGWGRLCLKINLMGGFAWANSCSSDCIQHECFDPQPHGPSRQDSRLSALTILKRLSTAQECQVQIPSVTFQHVFMSPPFRSLLHKVWAIGQQGGNLLGAG